MSNQKKQAEGAKAPEAENKNNKTIDSAKNNKAKEKDNQEWLEEELEDVDMNDADASSDELMKKAAEQIEKLQVEVEECKLTYKWICHNLKC